MTKMFCKKFILFLILFFSALTLYGFSFESYGVKGGVMYVRNSHLDSAPSPALPFLGVNAGFHLNKNYFLEPSIIFNWSLYSWSENEKMALPAEIEYADSVLLLNFIIDCPFVLKFRITENVSICPFVSPVFIFRFPIRAWGEGDSSKSDIMSYFYNSRFIFLELGTFVEWYHSPRHSLKARLDALLPVYNLWTESYSITDHFSIKASITFSFLTKNGQQRIAAASAASAARSSEETAR